MDRNTALAYANAPPVTGERRPITPLDWAQEADPDWYATPFHVAVNDALMDIIGARYEGRAEHLLLMAPPQHGKTTEVGHAFPATWFGYFPDDRIILASYEAETAEKRGRRVRDELIEHGMRLHGQTVDPDKNAASEWQILGRRGSMISRGVGGAITGAACELFIVDDPVKDAKDVRSKVFRDDQWDWYMRVVARRMRNRTCSVFMYTAWHPDDLGQRMIRASVRGDIPPLKILRFPAISETQEERDAWAEEMGLPAGRPDPLGRPPGVALWEAEHSLASLLRWKKADPIGFAALGQGRPKAEGGNIFSADYVKGRVVKPSDVPADSQFCRAWDKAASVTKRSDYTAGALMARDPRGRYYLIDVSRLKLSPGARNEAILQAAHADRNRWGNVMIHGDQDPGQAGVSEAEDFRRLLEAFWVETQVPSGDKETRGRPFVSAAQAGNVSVVGTESGDLPHWYGDWVDEMEAFPNGAHDDQWDATGAAYNRLAGRNSGSTASARNLIDDYEGEVEPMKASYLLAR